MTDKHKQLELASLKDTEKNQDFNFSHNTIQTNKNFIIKKNKVVADEKELSINYGQRIKLKSVPFSYSILLDDYWIGVSNVGTARTITLPKPSLAGPGKIYLVTDLSGSAASTTITISPFSTELIDGDTTKVINTNYGRAKLGTDGINWYSQS